MKKFIFLLTALCMVNLTFASFPITQSTLETNTQSEQIDEISIPISNVSNGGAGWGIAALACGFIGLLTGPIGALVLGLLAIVFGAIGLKKNLKGLAIAGLILGIIELLIIGLLVGIILAVV